MSRSRRLTTIALSLVAAGLFSFAIYGGRWWMIGEVGVGTVSTQRCFGGSCESGSMAWAGGSEMWERAGTATWAAGLVTSLVLLALAGALAAGRAAKVAASVAMIATITAIVAGGVFIAQRPDMPGIEMARGVWLYSAGVVVALGAAIAVYRSRGDTPA